MEGQDLRALTRGSSWVTWVLGLGWALGGWGSACPNLGLYVDFIEG